jgi:serine/threonine-protein kinase HipA
MEQRGIIWTLTERIFFNVSESDNAIDLSLVLSIAPYFRLSDARAHEILDQVRQAVRKWPIHAHALGLSASECALKAPPFA